MKVVSFNVWFDRYKREDRLESLITSLFVCDPDIICFQEVVPEIFIKLKDILKQYTFYSEDQDRKYFCVIASKFPFKKTFSVEYHPYTSMNRNILIAQFNVNNTKFCVATTHFESEFRKNNSIKMKQFKIAKDILDKLKLQNRFIVLCADSNINTENENLNYFRDWIDVWRMKGNENNRYTYDYKTNGNLNSRGIRFRSRIDRINIKGDVKIKEFNFVSVVDKMIDPSDHHGIYSVLEFVD